MSEAGVGQTNWRRRQSGFVVGGLAERARRELADPLFRNAYALMFNAAATGALGVVYWILAARYYDDADVGRGSAAVAAMMLLSALTAVNLTGMVSRFLPRAGTTTPVFILKTYLASGIAAAVITVGFLLTLPRWVPSFARLDGLGPGAAFTIAVVAWGVFTLQDTVLTALRSAVWVPLENIAFGLLKIVLVVVLATVLPHDGVFASWVLPVALSVVPINLLILCRLVPRHVRATEDRHAPPALREVGRFLAGDYVGSSFMLGAVYLVPVVVAAQVDPSTNAYFYVAWIIAGVIDLLAVNMAISLTVEGTLDGDRLDSKTRAALGRMVQILLPTVAGTALLAHTVLGVYGPGYAQYGAPLLQLLVLSALPRALVELYFGRLRVQSRTTRLALLQGLRCAMVIGLIVLLTRVFGITGAGWAVLVSQSTMAALVAPELLASMRRPAYARRLAGAVSRLLARWPSMPLTLLLGAGIALFLVPLQGVRLEAMNGYGLVSVLPVASLVGVGLLTLAYLLTLALDRPRPVFLAAQLAVLVVCLHGVTAFVESAARFPTAWQHLGFLDYIGRTGDLAPTLDARFNWPGFFAVMSFFARAVGISDAALLKPAPVLAELLYLVPYALLLACIRASWRAKWFAAFLLVVSNWVGQDYFSPQSLNFLIYLLLLAIVLTWFGISTPSPAQGVVKRLRQRVPAYRAPPSLERATGPTSAESTEPGELPPRPATTGQRIALAALIMGLFAVSTASHQISPFMMIAAVAALVVVRRCELTGLPLLFGVVMVSWLSFMAVGYWSGHLSEIFGNVGNLGSNVEESIQGRASQSDPQHIAVVQIRLALAGALLGLGALGALRRRRDGLRDRALLVLAVAPLIAIGLQSYGGEIGLRTYLFALPALCVLAASALFGLRMDRPSWWRITAGFVCALVLVGGFLVARYGNEPAERTTGDELAALDFIYRHDSQGARVAWLTPEPESDWTPSMPAGARDMEKIDYVGAEAPRDPGRVSGILRSLRELGPDSYLIVNRAQTAYLALTYSYPPDWGDRMRARLDALPALQRVFDSPDAAVYRLASSSTKPAPPPPTYPGLSIRMTPLTPLGIVLTPLLIAVLVARELLRIRLPLDAQARLVPLTRLAYLLLVLWGAVVLERFVRLS